jgi:HAD superfamily hydrolase (TIGR01509 family)
VGQVGLVLITNGLKEVQRSRLARSTISDCFSDVVISDEVGAAKPDVRIFQVAFERMGNPEKADVLIVGDSLTSDIKGGNEYGIDTCWFNPAQLVCDQDVEIQYEIRRLDELRTIVGVD